MFTKYAVIIAAGATMLASCGGGKVVVNPAVAAPPVAQAPAAQAPVVVTAVPATPAPPAEARNTVVSPGPDYVWVDGYYAWRGNRYEWEPGKWVRPNPPTATWVPGHWQQVAGGFSWVDGHWQTSAE